MPTCQRPLLSIKNGAAALSLAAEKHPFDMSNIGLSRVRGRNGRETFACRFNSTSITISAFGCEQQIAHRRRPPARPAFVREIVPTGEAMSAPTRATS